MASQIILKNGQDQEFSITHPDNVGAININSNELVSAVTGFSQISGVNEIVGSEPTDNIHNIFNDGSNIATYQLNGNANSLGGTYNATAVNVTYEEGKFGQAAKFNGSSSYINNFNLPDSTNVTISTWVKLNATPTLNFIYGQINSGGADVTMGVSLAITSNGLRIYQNNISYKEFNFSFNIGVWYNIVHIVEGTTASVYVNNTLVGGHNFSSNRLPFNNANFAFGKFGAWGSNPFNGSMDQIRVFNRALSAQEVNTLYTETKVSVNAQLNINQGTFIYPKGLGARGYIKSSDIFTGTVDVSAQTDGWKYVAKDENNNFSFYTDKPTIGKKSSALYLENGKLYKQVDDTPITPISFLSNKVRIASGVAVELAPSGIAKTVTESLEAKEMLGKNQCTAWVNFDGTTTPPTIRDSYNVSSVVRTDTGKFDIYFEKPMDNTNYVANYNVNGGILGIVKNLTPTINKVHVQAYISGTFYNVSYNDVQIFGGKN